MSKKKTKGGKSAGQTLQWTSWPLRQRPIASGGLIVFILAVSLYSYITFGHAVYALIALIVLCAAVGDYVFPTDYRLDGDGITIRAPFTTRKIAWDEYRYYAVGDGVIVLANSLEIDRANVRRCPWLRCPENSEEVARYLSRHLEDLKKARESAAKEGAPDA